MSPAPYSAYQGLSNIIRGVGRDIAEDRAQEAKEALAEKQFGLQAARQSYDISRDKLLDERQKIQFGQEQELFHERKKGLGLANVATQQNIDFGKSGEKRVEELSLLQKQEKQQQIKLSGIQIKGAEREWEEQEKTDASPFDLTPLAKRVMNEGGDIDKFEKVIGNYYPGYNPKTNTFIDEKGKERKLTYRDIRTKPGITHSLIGAFDTVELAQDRKDKAALADPSTYSKAIANLIWLTSFPGTPESMQKAAHATVGHYSSIYNAHIKSNEKQKDFSRDLHKAGFKALLRSEGFALLSPDEFAEKLGLVRNAAEYTAASPSEQEGMIKTEILTTPPKLREKLRGNHFKMDPQTSLKVYKEIEDTAKKRMAETTERNAEATQASRIAAIMGPGSGIPGQPSAESPATTPSGLMSIAEVEGEPVRPKRGEWLQRSQFMAEAKKREAEATKREVDDAVAKVSDKIIGSSLLTVKGVGAFRASRSPVVIAKETKIREVLEKYIGSGKTWTPKTDEEKDIVAEYESLGALGARKKTK